MRARYPRLAAAWRLLLAAPLLAGGVASADASIPPAGEGHRDTVVPTGTTVDGKLTPCPRSTGGVAPSVASPDPQPPMPGVMIAPRQKAKLEKTPPKIKKSDWQVTGFELHVDGGLVLHPHGPEEPCKKG